MKVLGNALLGAAMLSSPALADDVAKHSQTLNSAYWQPTTVAAIQERSRTNMPLELDDVAPCSPSDVLHMRGVKKGEVVLSREDAIKARYSKIDELLDWYEREQNGRLAGKKDRIVKAVDYEILQLKLAGEDVYSNYAKSGGPRFDNLAKHVIGIEDINALNMPAGVHDYVSGKPLNLGQVTLGGCVVTLDEDPNLVVSMEMNGRINGVSMVELDKLLVQDKATYYKNKFDTKKHFAYATNYVDKYGNDHAYVHMDTFKHNDSYTIDTFFHELKHTHLEDRMLTRTMGDNAKEFHDSNTEIEVRATLYGAAKLGQVLIAEKGADAFNNHIDAMIKEHSERIVRESADMIILRQAMVSSGVDGEVISALNSDRVRNAFSSEDVCAGFSEDARRMQSSIDDCLYKVKNPYNPLLALSLLKEVIRDSNIDVAQISNSQLDVLVNDTVTASMHVMSDHITMNSSVLQGMSNSELAQKTREARAVYNNTSHDFSDSERVNAQLDHGFEY